MAAEAEFEPSEALGDWFPMQVIYASKDTALTLIGFLICYDRLYSGRAF